jgi:tripartite-type tricarboxylate transporter receptor subunit TctC
MTTRRRMLRGAVGAAAALAAPNFARAQGRYPDRPVRIVVPFPAGGGTDTMARMVIDAGFQAALGVPVIVDNRGGGSTMIGSDHVAKSAPDGHTLLFTITTLVQAPIALRQFPYRPVEDFTWLGRLGTGAITFTIGPAVPASVTTLAEFVAWGQGKPLAFGNYSSGSTPHAFAVMLAQETKLNVTQVSYRGEAPMLQDLLGGQFHGGFHSTIVAGEMMRVGRVRPLATGGLHRVPSLADRVPTLRELGYSRRFDFAGFIGLLGPARLPPEVVARLVPAFRETLAVPELQRKLAAQDIILGYEDPETFRATGQPSFDQWREIAESLDLYATG